MTLLFLMTIVLDVGPKIKAPSRLSAKCVKLSGTPSAQKPLKKSVRKNFKKLNLFAADVAPVTQLHIESRGLYVSTCINMYLYMSLLTNCNYFNKSFLYITCEYLDIDSVYIIETNERKIYR